MLRKIRINVQFLSSPIIRIIRNFEALRSYVARKSKSSRTCMDPAVNRDAAERCLKKAENAYRAGQIEVAKRLASKSDRLCPSNKAKGTSFYD